MPLVFRGRSLGLMELIETERERRFTEREVRLARALAEQAAIALNNARLYQRSKEYAARLESSYLETVTALAAAMEAKDHYTAEHADMLAMMAVVGRPQDSASTSPSCATCSTRASSTTSARSGSPGTSSTSPTSSPTRSSP